MTKLFKQMGDSGTMGIPVAKECRRKKSQTIPSDPGSQNVHGVRAEPNTWPH
jgi:hypothetical protein